MAGRNGIERKAKLEISTRPRIVLVARAIIVDQGKFLLVQRSQKDRYDPGNYEFPGGKVDPGETFNEALEEEVYEEAKLIVEPARQVAYVSERIITTGPYRNLLYRVEAVICRRVAGRVKLSEEHDRFKWTTLNQTDNLRLTRFTEKALIELGPQIVHELKLRGRN